MANDIGSMATTPAPLDSSQNRLPFLWIGTWSMAGVKYGRSDLGESARLLARAFDFGCCYFDSAPIYGDGVSEQLLGTFIRGRREKVVVSTKGGLRWKGNTAHHHATPEALREDLEGSLSRMATDYIDIYSLHWPDPAVPLEDSIGALERFKEDGLIRHWGISNWSAEQVMAYLPPRQGICHQVHHNILTPRSPVLDAGDDGRCLSLAISPFEQGRVFSNDYRLGKRDFRRRNPLFSTPAVNETVSRLQQWVDGTALSILDVALMTLWQDSRCHGAIAGPRTCEQFNEIEKHVKLLSDFHCFGRDQQTSGHPVPTAVREVLNAQLPSAAYSYIKSLS